MICWISSCVLRFLLNNLDISPEMKEAYQYGIEITISSILNIVLILICSVIVGNIWAGIIYLFVFIFLRSFTGGYHATTYFKCNATFVITFIMTFTFYKIICFYDLPIFMCGLIAVADLIPIAILAPVPNKHKPLDYAQKKHALRLSLIIAPALLIMGLLLLILRIAEGTMIITTVTTVSVLMIIEFFLQRRGYHEC